MRTGAHPFGWRLGLKPVSAAFPADQFRVFTLNHRATPSYTIVKNNYTREYYGVGVALCPRATIL